MTFAVADTVPDVFCSVSVYLPESPLSEFMMSSEVLDGVDAISMRLDTAALPLMVHWAVGVGSPFTGMLYEMGRPTLTLMSCSRDLSMLGATATREKMDFIGVHWFDKLKDVGN